MSFLSIEGSVGVIPRRWPVFGWRKRAGSTRVDERRPDELGDVVLQLPDQGSALLELLAGRADALEPAELANVRAQMREHSAQQSIKPLGVGPLPWP
jgi:hypothetical protein